jgi:hypothetical protein
MEQAIMFIRLAAQLKWDIQLPLPCNQSESSMAPVFLPASVEQFLSKAIQIPVECIEDTWDAFKSDVWAANPILFCEDNLALFKKHGWTHGLSKSITH